ncbi:hypothetical protein [Arhodomonas sp. AD133]|uniref:hypothetical protein n=1 Tax=Arhodomonas sp. AD133 TaxID=3415009 RepID=UPI003EBA027A
MTKNEEVLTEPSLERRTRRRFSAAEKQRLLSEHEQQPHGEKGAWLRRNGLYAAQLAEWRRTLGETGRQGLEPGKGGRKARDPKDREIEKLKRQKAKAEQRAQRAEELVDLQKKLFALIEDHNSESSP